MCFQDCQSDLPALPQFFVANMQYNSKTDVRSRYISMIHNFMNTMYEVIISLLNMYHKDTKKKTHESIENKKCFDIFLFSKCKNGNCIKLKHHEKYGEPPVAGIFLLVLKTSYYINIQIYHVTCNNNTFRSVCCSPGINGSKISTVIRYCKG